MMQETLAPPKHICQGEYVVLSFGLLETTGMPDKNLAAMECLFTSLADRTRLRLLNLMAEREVCVCYFVGVLDAPQPTISRHLAYLRRKGLVATRREGKWMHYSIAFPENASARQLLTATLRWLAEDKDMQKDRARLALLRQLAAEEALQGSRARACCNAKELKTIGRAPLPMPAKLAPGRN